jgi:heterodisulfide reductase subunit B
MKLAYYPGCTLHASSALYDVQCKLVLKELGVELQELEDWNCCGATSAAKTNDFLSIALPARNLGIAGASGLPGVVIPCSSCYSRMLVSQDRLSKDRELKDSINEELAIKLNGGVRVLSILEMLLKSLDSGELKEKTKTQLSGLKPACYYGCLLTRFPCDIDAPDDVENPQGMETVCGALGAEPLDWSYKTDCCGASASVNDTDTALDLMSVILRDASARGANCLVTTCPMCQFNLDAYQDKAKQRHGGGKAMPVYFITELLGTAMGIGPGKMQLNRHFVEPVGLLRELDLV